MTMKRFRYTIILFALVLLLTQCNEDNSNINIREINPIEIDNSVQKQNVSVFQMDTLHMFPMVYKNGVEDDHLTYEWKLTGQGIVPTVLGTTMTLHAVIGAPPTAESYTLTLTVTDTETTLQNFATYNVKVESQFGNGLVVADSEDGGITCDISLIRAENFSGFYDMRNNRIFRDVYSAVNQELVKGKVLNMISSQGATGGSRFLTILTPSNVYRMDPYKFELQDQDRDLFYTAISSEFKPIQVGYIDNLNCTNFINIGGDIYIHNLKYASKYAAKFITTDKSPYRIGKASNSELLDNKTWQAETPYLFDELNNRILQMDRACQMITVFDKVYVGKAFDFNNIGAFDALFMGRGQDGNIPAIQMVLKTEGADNYYCYVFGVVDAEPMYIYNLNNCENIKNAVAYESNPKEDIFYYATGEAIYSIQMYGGNEITAKKCYTSNNGEIITGMKLWRARGWMQGKVRISNPNEPSGYSTIDALNNMLVISTYNESTKEGKIIAIAIPNLGSGELEQNRKFHVEYGGFHQIINFDAQNL